MFTSIDWTALAGLGIASITAIGCVKAYLAQTDKNLKREHEQELMKVRLYTDRDIKTAQIESSALMQGFTQSVDDEDSVSAILQFAAQNPEIVKKFTENFKKQ